MAWDSWSRTAGRGSDCGGLALACSVGDSMGVNGERGTFGENGDGTAADVICEWDADVSIGENGVTGWEIAD